jgi:hypothetical protein
METRMNSDEYSMHLGTEQEATSREQVGPFWVAATAQTDTSHEKVGPFSVAVVLKD